MARKMKDSSIEWIGEIPIDFTLYKLKYLLSSPLCYGANESGTLYSDILPRYIRITDISPNGTLKNSGMLSLDESSAQNYMLHEGDILFARSGATVGKSFIYHNYYGRAAYAGYLIKASFNRLVLPEFVYYYTCSSAYEIWKNSIFIQSTIQNIGADRYSNLPISVPNSIDKQLRIVHYLNDFCSKFDAIIYNLQTSIEEYKKLKQAVITQAVTKGVCGKREMKDSGVEWIGEIPKHWSVIPSKFLFANCDERRREGDVQLTASQKYGMISQEEYMRRENARIVLADKGLENWKHVEPFDFVISLRSFQGGLEMSEVTGCATWHYIILRARQRIHPYYYKWLFKSSMYITTLQRTCNYIRDGQDLRYSNFVKVPLCIPTLYEQQKIADFLDRKCAKIDHLITLKQSKIEKLEQYKRSLIYEYVTGKREVSCDE